MTTEEARAEKRYHESIRIPEQSRRWRVTDENEFWVACCGVTSSLRFEDAASAQDAALSHMRTCPEARRG